MATGMEELFQDYIEAWNSHDLERIVSYVTDDIVFEDVAMARVMHGREELKGFGKDSFGAFPDFKIELKVIFISGSWAGAEWVMSGTFLGDWPGLSPTGKSFSVRGASVCELRGGKLKRESLYYDGLAFLQQLGVMPEMPSV